ncbi:MAG: hypothetical protein COA32_16980 [Fluviicola sp.]|nr:MAG: hypothetical protein COA32_16980 [Fluviicola sp.]
MENAVKNDCYQSDLIINLKTRNKVKFKAGAELSGQVNIVNVDFNEEVNDKEQILDLKLHLKRKECERSEHTDL